MFFSVQSGELLSGKMYFEWKLKVDVCRAAGRSFTWAKATRQTLDPSRVRESSSQSITFMLDVRWAPLTLSRMLTSVLSHPNLFKSGKLFRIAAFYSPAFTWYPIPLRKVSVSTLPCKTSHRTRWNPSTHDRKHLQGHRSSPGVDFSFYGKHCFMNKVLQQQGGGSWMTDQHKSSMLYDKVKSAFPHFWK